MPRGLPLLRKATAVSGLQRCCVDCGDWVDQADAAIVGVNEVGSGPGLPAWACLPCLDARADRPAFIGRRDAAPIRPTTAPAPPGDAA